MLKLNEPIRIVCKDDDFYEFIITRESKKIEGNEEIYNFIMYLRQKKVFDKGIINEYIQKNDYSNEDEYLECFDAFIQNNIIINS